MKRDNRSADSRRALTLLEVLVVVAIVGLLAGLTIPAIQHVRQSGFRVRCGNNLRQIGLALHQHHQAARALPPGSSYRQGSDPYPHMTWCTRLLPFLELTTLWTQAVQAFAQDRNFLTDPPHTGLATVVPVFLCPADGRSLRDAGPRAALLSYLGVEGQSQSQRSGALYLDSSVTFGAIHDGLSQTLLAGERPPSPDQRFGWWYAGWGLEKDGTADAVLGVRAVNAGRPGIIDCPEGPYYYRPGQLDNQCDALHFWSVHGGGAHFLFCDGSVRFLAYSADPIMPALATRAGSEAVEVP